MYTLQSLELLLKSLGFDKLKSISSKKIAVLVNSNRVKALEDIQKALKGSRYDSTPSSESSIGKVIVDGFAILAKPASKQGAASAGVENELIVVNTINNIAKTGPVNVVFKGKNKDFVVMGCVEARSVGADTTGRKKADIQLRDVKNNYYPISIKKDDAETWESADSYFSAEAKKIIQKAINEKKAKLISENTYFQLEPNIAVKATEQEKKEVVFGSDLENKGCIITKTFSSSSFKQEEDTLIIECTHIITALTDVKDDKDVYFLIRNDKTRKSIKEYPGIRVLAAYKKRINQNVVILSR